MKGAFKRGILALVSVLLACVAACSPDSTEDKAHLVGPHFMIEPDSSHPVICARWDCQTIDKWDDTTYLYNLMAEQIEDFIANSPDWRCRMIGVAAKENLSAGLYNVGYTDRSGEGFVASYHPGSNTYYFYVGEWTNPRGLLSDVIHEQSHSTSGTNDDPMGAAFTSAYGTESYCMAGLP